MLKLSKHSSDVFVALLIDFTLVELSLTLVGLQFLSLRLAPEPWPFVGRASPAILLGFQQTNYAMQHL